MKRRVEFGMAQDPNLNDDGVNGNPPPQQQQPQQPNGNGLENF